VLRHNAETTPQNHLCHGHAVRAAHLNTDAGIVLQEATVSPGLKLLRYYHSTGQSGTSPETEKSTTMGVRRSDAMAASIITRNDIRFLSRLRQLNPVIA